MATTKKATKFSKTFAADTERGLEEQIKDAGRAAGQREYWEAVKSFAREALDEHPDDEEKQEEHVWESVDGSSWVIYTAENYDVLRFTQNNDAWQDLGELDPSKAIMQMAFYALRADVMDELTQLRKQKEEE